MGKQEAITALQKMAPKGATILAAHLGRDDSGMERVISFASAWVNDKHELELRDITLSAASATGYEIRGIAGGTGIVIDGTGADHVTEFAQELGQVIWEDPHAYKDFTM